MRELPAVHVLTVSSGLPLSLLDALLTRTEAVLHQYGAARVWIDPTGPGTTVLAEFPPPSGRSAPNAGPDAAVMEPSSTC